MASIFEIRARAQAAEGIPAPSSRRDYSAIYAAVRAYHERQTPLNDWAEAADDISRTAQSLDNDPFALALLSAVFGELERAYKAGECNP